MLNAVAPAWGGSLPPGEDAVRKSNAVIPMLSCNDAKDLHAAIEYAQENPPVWVPLHVQLLSPAKVVFCPVLVRIQEFLKCPEVESAAATDRINGECLCVSDTDLKKLSLIQIGCRSQVLSVVTESIENLHLEARL